MKTLKNAALSVTKSLRHLAPSVLAVTACSATMVVLAQEADGDQLSYTEGVYNEAVISEAGNSEQVYAEAPLETEDSTDSEICFDDNGEEISCM